MTWVVATPRPQILFALLDSVQRAARAPRIHRVLIGPALNAGVAAVPRLGVFCWNRYYLTIGLPLIQSVSESEFTAVIAHEFGHLAGRSSWFAVGCIGCA